MNERFKNTERLLDKEVHDIKAINLHTPKTQRNETQYDEDDMDLMAAQAINNQWQEKREEFEIEWDKKRAAMEAEYRETIEEQTSLQTSLVAYETENIREQFKTMLQQDIAQARQTLQDISNQNATLKKNIDNKSRQIGHLHTEIGEIKELKESLKQDTDTLDTLKTTTKNVIDKLKQTTQAAERIQQIITSQVTKAVHETIQGIVENKMVQVEEAIRHSLLQKGWNIVQQAKTSMQKQQMETTKELEARIADKSNDTYHQAASLLEQAVMHIGEEMDSVIIDFRNTLAQPHKRLTYIDSLQRQVMKEIRPGLSELQIEMTQQATQELHKAVKEAQNDLHINQGKLTADTKTTFRMHNEILTLNVAAMKTDLRHEAELLEAELTNGQNKDTRQRHTEEPPLQPSTPEPEAQESRRTTNNPYERAPQVSPHQDVNIPSEDTWNSMVCKCKEKVTLTYTLPQNAKDLDQSQVEAFYRQIESNFKGYPAVRLRKFDDLTR
jgi:hypothetical protein